MAGRKPGPPPKNPQDRLRTNADPMVGRDGWTEIAPEPFSGSVPEIPAWTGVSGPAAAVYEELARLPQAVLWGPGTWLQLHLALPLIERYLARPGSENFKAIVSTLGAGLRLTEDDMQKARVRTATANDEQGDAPKQSATVTAIASRRDRLTG